MVVPTAKKSLALADNTATVRLSWLAIYAALLSFSFQSGAARRPCVYGPLLGRGSAYSFWLRLRQSSVPPRAGKARPIHHSHPAPGHRARVWGHPSLSGRLLRHLCYLVPQFQAPVASLRRAMRRRLQRPALVADFQASVGLRCNHIPAALQHRKIQVRQATVDGVPEPSRA